MRCQTHDAMILTAGLGTRLRPLTDVRAKPAIPVAGEPMVRRIARWLAAGGVTDIVLNLHHLPETIAAVVGDGSDLSVRVRYSWEQPVLLGAAGGPRHALAIVGADTFLLINGDTLTDLDSPGSPTRTIEAARGSRSRSCRTASPGATGASASIPAVASPASPGVAKPKGRITSSACRWFGPRCSGRWRPINRRPRSAACTIG